MYKRQVLNASKTGRSNKKERRVDALALRADEGRDKLRKATGRSKYPSIRRCPNEGTDVYKRQMQGIKQRINNVILTGQGITNINTSDVAGKIALNIPVKISTGRLISTVRPEYRTDASFCVDNYFAFSDGFCFVRIIPGMHLLRTKAVVSSLRGTCEWRRASSILVANSTQSAF